MLKSHPKYENAFTEESRQQQAAFLGSSLILNGELSGNEDFVIEGRFQGKINLGKHNLTVGHKARLIADIQANDITIKGQVEGNILASGRVTIEKEGRMTGDITASRISIVDGAQFKGSVKMASLIK